MKINLFLYFYSIVKTKNTLITDIFGTPPTEAATPIKPAPHNIVPQAKKKPTETEYLQFIKTNKYLWMMKKI